MVQAKPIEIIEASTPQDVAQVTDLCRAFRAWSERRYAHRPELVEAYYPGDSFEALLAELPTKHARPGGAMLLARIDGAAVGCVMLSPLEDGVCEMKRLFVAEAARGKGVARALCLALFDGARAAGYHTMRLDTGDEQPEAHALYRSLGFLDRSPYYDAPPVLRDSLVFMEKAL